MITDSEYWLGVIDMKIRKYQLQLNRKPTKILMPYEAYRVLEIEFERMYNRRVKKPKVFGIDVIVVYDSIDIMLVTEID